MTGGAALSAGRGPATVLCFSRALGQGVPRPPPRTFLLLRPSVIRIAAGGGGGLRTCCLGCHQEEEGYVRTCLGCYIFLAHCKCLCTVGASSSSTAAAEEESVAAEQVQDPAAELYRIPQLAALGRAFKSGPEVSLTETEVKYLSFRLDFFSPYT